MAACHLISWTSMLGGVVSFDVCSTLLLLARYTCSLYGGPEQKCRRHFYSHSLNVGHVFQSPSPSPITVDCCRYT